ncbi:hypothetical protein CCB80_11425 [Armatimonadetes bacterium Uphvl-Ar1]|nr:hypothetical protein CCB80_11425 [Armatimonadetes bacterium Uphvl-Ar1]
MKNRQIGALFLRPKGGRAATANSVGETPLRKCLRLATSAGDINEILNEILREATLAVGADGAYALSIDPYDPGSLSAISAYSPSGTFNFPHQVPIPTTISGQAKTNRQTIVVRSTDSEAFGQIEFGQEIEAVLAVPLFARSSTASLNGSVETAQGTLTFISQTKSLIFDEAARSTAEDFAHIFSMALANAQNELFRRTTLIDSLEQISTYIESKDQNRREHAARTAQIAAKIGEKLGLASETIEEIRIAATLMDIGYIAIPESILQKPEALTAEEFAMVQMHQVISYEICKKLGLPDPILELIRTHHEKLDGSGYPSQITNNEISLASRILMVADAFDAMRCKRAHRDGLTQKEALKQLLIEAGSKFDPEVVQALRLVVDERALDYIYGDAEAA